MKRLSLYATTLLGTLYFTGDIQANINQPDRTLRDYKENQITKTLTIEDAAKILDGYQAAMQLDDFLDEVDAIKERAEKREKKSQAGFPANEALVDSYFDTPKEKMLGWIKPLGSLLGGYSRVGLGAFVATAGVFGYMLFRQRKN